MDELICNAILNSDANKIIISNLTSSDFDINISGDVDFTNLVQELTKKIDEEKIISLTIEDEASITDSKYKLIIDTLKNIFNSYNESLQSYELDGINNDETEF
jgi:hypothetical protein